MKKTFNELRNIFIIDTIMAYFNSDKKTIVEIDTLDYISGEILS